MKKQVLLVGLALGFGIAGLVLAQTGAAQKAAQHSSVAYRMEITTEGQAPVGFDYQSQGSQNLMKMQSKKSHVEMLQTGDREASPLPSRSQFSTWPVCSTEMEDSRLSPGTIWIGGETRWLSE